MTAPVLYVNFPGSAREALEFYADVFGGDLQLHTFGDFSRTDGPADSIAHGMLSGGPVSLFGSDVGPGEEPVRIAGALLALLGTAEPEVLHVWFDRLADGGTILDPLEPRPWGASDGQVVDKFGLRWLIGYEPDT
jgi:PhnB protein